MAKFDFWEENDRPKVEEVYIQDPFLENISLNLLDYSHATPRPGTWVGIYRKNEQVGHALLGVEEAKQARNWLNEFIARYEGF